MVFAGNDRPGVMLAGAARTYANRYGVAAGSRAVVYTSGDDGWRSVTDLAAAGTEIAAVVDTRADVAAEHRALADKLGARLVAGGLVCGTSGGKSLGNVEIIGADRRKLKIDADLLAMSNGWNPAVHLTCHLGAKPKWDDAAEMPSCRARSRRA
jgi:NADPH-dependent 2,4-dienoyl-CoA reductase/sulfur reductase-like enzyme